MPESIASQKSFALAVRVIKLCRYLRERGVERELLSQLLRSGTSIAANLSEAAYAHSPSDFHHKVRIALKECAETHTWLKLLHATGGLSDAEFDSIGNDCVEIRKVLSSIVCTIQQRQDGKA